MNSDDAIFFLEAATRLHTDGYMTDEAYERFKQHIVESIIREHERYKRPWWKIW